MTFDYGLPADLFMLKRKVGLKRKAGARQRLGYRRFATAAASGALYRHASRADECFHYVVMMRPLSDKKRGPAHRRLGGGTQTISSAAWPAARRVRQRADFQRKTCHSGGLQRCRKTLSAPH